METVSEPGMTVYRLLQKYAAKTLVRSVAGACLGLFFSAGCAVSSPGGLSIEGSDALYPPGTIVRTADCSTLRFEQLMAELSAVPVVYVGERHSRKADHRIQLQIAKAMRAESEELCIGLEMVDHTYQKRLDQWRRGRISVSRFLESIHWYANWKYDFALYREIFLYIRQEKIPLVALNIPPHIPPKIAVGGIDSLRSVELSHLPDAIDMSNEKHRAYVRRIFQHHKEQPGFSSFAHFYAAQCVWEDAMAETIVQTRGQRPMLVLAGSGHLRHRYGIPARAYKREPAAYRIVLPLAAGQTISPKIADYIWVTEPEEARHPPMP